MLTSPVPPSPAPSWKEVVAVREPAKNEFDASRDGFPSLAPARATALLMQLREAHDELAAALHTLDEMTAGAHPDVARYPHARWRLSSARRRRRAVASEIYAELPAAVAPAEAAAISRLRADDDRRLRDSALHVQHWTSERIAADWQGYCAASAPLRATLREWMAAERALLYPLLERCARTR